MTTVSAIVSCYEKGDQNELEKLLSALSDNELKSLIKRSSNHFGDQLLPLIRALFQNLHLTSDDVQKRRLIVYEESMSILQKDIPTKVGIELIGILLLEMDELSAENLAKLAVEMIDLIKNGDESYGRSLDLLPKLVTLLTSKDSVPYAGSEISGEEYKQHFLNDLCSVRWGSQSATQFASMFRDIPLTAKELQFVTDKLIRLLQHMELSTIPSLVYQLLLLSTKEKGQNQLVLEGILAFFHQADKKISETSTVQNDSNNELEEISHSREELRQTEGTVILHITFAMTQDQDLGKEFVKYVKAGQQNPKHLLMPFTIALGLSVTRFQCFQEPIFDSFKCAITKSFKEFEMKKTSEWFREMSSDNVDVSGTFLEVVKNSAFGWDYVTQGLVELGFILMKMSLVKTFGRKPTNVATEPLPLDNPIANLGSDILLNVFKASDLVRSSILEQILNYTFTHGALAAPYINLLSQIVQASPLFVLDCTSKIQQTLHSLPMLKPVSANALIKSISPLLRVSMPLKESLILVLRKSMFSGQLDWRKIAVNGYLRFLKYFKILGYLPLSQASQASSCSQISADVHTSINPDANEAFCLELLRTLRCALSQQAEIRQMLYVGLYSVFCENMKLQGPILDVLQSHFTQYYVSNQDVNPPLKLETTVLIQNQTVTLMEPLAILLQYIHKCVLESERYLEISNGQRPENYIQVQQNISSLKAILDSLVERMITVELEDFELDKSADYSNTTSVGMKNNQLATILLGVYEALMEYLLSSQKISSVVAEKVLSLFYNHKGLISVLKGSGTKGGKNSGKTVNNVKLPNSLFTVEMITKLLANLWETANTDLDCLRNSDEFLRYCVTVAASQKVQQLKQTGFCDGIDSENYAKNIVHVYQLAKIFFDYYNLHLNSAAESEGKTITLPSSCLEIFSIIVSVISTQQPKRLVEFLITIEGRSDKSSISSSAPASTFQGIQDSNRVYLHIRRFQKCVNFILNQNEDNRSMKDFVFLFNIITTLVPHVSPDGEQFEQVLTWVNTLCTKQKIDDLTVVKPLVQLFFNLLNQTRTFKSVIPEMAQDIHAKMGDIDEEVQVENCNHFAVISEHSATTIQQMIIQYLDQVLSHVDWVINGLKADLVSLPNVDFDETDISAPTQQELRDKKICNYLGMFLTATHELVQTALPLGVSIERLLKVLIHFYNTLNLFVKYYLSMYTLTVGRLCSKFKKLVKVVGTMLSPQVYLLITYLQALHTTDGEKENKKRKLNPVLQKTKILRETRQIPTLIFAIEQSETSLMQLTKKSKVNLMENVKLSTSRDFRINVESVKAAAAANQSSGDENEDHELQTENGTDEPNDHTDQRPAKRARRGGKLKRLTTR